MSSRTANSHITEKALLIFMAVLTLIAMGKVIYNQTQVSNDEIFPSSYVIVDENSQSRNIY